MNKDFSNSEVKDLNSDKQLADHEKIALVEINPHQAKLVLAWSSTNGTSFEVFDEYVEELHIYDDIERDGVIKPNQIAECREIIKMYRRLCDSLKICKSIAYATHTIRSAKNHYGFLDEMELASGFKFHLLSDEEEFNAIYSGVVNSLDVAKGLIIDIEKEHTRLIAYARRTILGQATLQFGSDTLKKLFMEGESNFETQCDIIEEFFLKQWETQNWVNELGLEEIQFVGVGDIFLSAGKISRKGRKYPLDIPHNYVMNLNDIDNVYKAIKGLKIDKDARIKGISQTSAGSIASGLAMLLGAIKTFNIQKIVVSNSDISTGVLFNHCVPLTTEKPIQDLLGYSLQANQKYYQPTQTNGSHVFELATLLFKQLRVMHRLPRYYIKPLKIACYMYNCGARIRFQPTRKDALHIILNSQIYGASHRDLIVAAFIAQSQHSEEFSLSEWVKYKDIVDEEDLQAVKRLSVIVRIAASLDCAEQGNVTDIVCDVLGDSVIMKTITSTDISFELRITAQAGADFKKVFGKTLELL